jgi:hypothetical protein
MNPLNAITPRGGILLPLIAPDRRSHRGELRHVGAILEEFLTELASIRDDGDRDLDMARLEAA